MNKSTLSQFGYSPLRSADYLEFMADTLYCPIVSQNDRYHEREL